MFVEFTTLAAALVVRLPSALPPRPFSPLRAGTLRASEGDGPSVGDELEAKLRKALSELSDEELTQSDARVLDNFVEAGLGAGLSGAELTLARELEEAQEKIEERLEGELRGIEDATLSKIDAAIASFKRGAANAPAAAAAATGAAAEPPSALLPKGSLVVVAGGGTPLGQRLLRALGSSDAVYQLRALVRTVATPTLELGSGREAEAVAFTPFAPTALQKGLAGCAALLIVSAAAGGKGGVEPEEMPKLVGALGSGVRRVLLLSTHGVERTDVLPFSMQNAFGGALDKQRAAEQEVILRARRDIPAYSIIRVGKLKEGGRAAPGGAAPCELAPGDALSGEPAAASVAEVMMQSLVRPEAINASFSIGRPIPAPGAESAGVAAEWNDQFLKLDGPEVYRRPLAALEPAAATVWLKEWARRFLRPGQKLTTPGTPRLPHARTANSPFHFELRPQSRTPLCTKTPRHTTWRTLLTLSVMRWQWPWSIWRTACSCASSPLRPATPTPTRRPTTRSGRRPSREPPSGRRASPTAHCASQPSLRLAHAFESCARRWRRARW